MQVRRSSPLDLRISGGNGRKGGGIFDSFSVTFGGFCVTDAIDSLLVEVSTIMCISVVHCNVTLPVRPIFDDGSMSIKRLG